MARIRSANPCAPVDEDVATMSLAARYVWAYLPCHADRDGRLKDSPFTIKANILPADNVDMNAILDELAERRHIIRYQVDGRKFIQIRSFHRHQSPHKREVQSVIPCPPGWLPMAPVHVPEEPGLVPASADPPPASVSPSPSIPVPDPVPVSPLPSPSGSTGNPDQTRSTPSAKLWNEHEWRERFGRAWAAKYQTIAYGHAGDTKACVSLGYVLGALPVAERLAAQAKAPEMFAEFLAGASPNVVASRHPFVFFVQDWGGLRVPRQATAPPKPAEKPWIAAEKAEEERKARERMEARKALQAITKQLADTKAVAS